MAFTEDPVISGVTLVTICITSNYTLRKIIVNIYNSIFFQIKLHKCIISKKITMLIFVVINNLNCNRNIDLTILNSY